MARASAPLVAATHRAAPLCCTLDRMHPFPRPSRIVRLVPFPALGIAVSLLLTTSCLAESPTSAGSADEGTRVRARGHSIVVAPPDLSIVDLAVASEAPEAAAAAQINAEQMHAVLDALDKAFADVAEVETSGYTLSPRYDFQKGTGRVLTGFTARSALRVKSRDVEAAGRIIDVAVGAGADEVRSVRFGLQDDTQQREQALAQATRQARRRAEVMAEAIGLRVRRIVDVDEIGSGAVPVFAQSRALSVQADASPTPIEAAGVEVRADVSIEVEAVP
jgi:uncharacterized protein YggE